MRASRAPILVWALMTAGGGCVSDGHPLGTDGKVEVRVSTDGALFATDELDEQGNPSGPRQTPFDSDVVLRLTEADEVGHGAFVQVHVEPAEALMLGAALDSTAEGALNEAGDEPTCDLVDGAFRCRGNVEGFARFSIRSAADWSGTARIVVSWANQVRETEVVVLPAGLPVDATNFQLLGVATGDRVPPTYLAVACTVDALPEDLGDKWPVGRIRAREVTVRATPPASNPGALENAPVIVETLSGDGALSLDESCADRTTRVRVLLDATGQSPRFFACLSDLGGDIGFAVSSGAKAVDPTPSIEVDAEPRILRVRVLDGKQTLDLTELPTDVFEVSAYDVSLQALPMDVDLDIVGVPADVLTLTEGSITLAPQGAAPVIVSAIPTNAGTGRLVVTPRLLAEPQCSSDDVTVLPIPD